MLKTIMKLTAIVLVCLTAVLPAGAQNTAEIRGTVADSTGAVLPGVSLALTLKASSQERRQLTDTNGSYVFASLPNGDYLLTAALQAGSRLHRISAGCSMRAPL